MSSHLRIELRDPGNAHVDFRYFIPGGIIHDTGGAQAKDGLELPDCRGGVATENAVLCDFGDAGVYVGDGIELFLHLQHLGPGGAHGQVAAGPGGRDARDLLCGVDVHGIAVIVAQNVNGGIAVVGQGFAAPLRQPFCKNV